MNWVHRFILVFLVLTKVKFDRAMRYLLLHMHHRPLLPSHE